MKKGRFFPEDHRSFCNGRLSLNIDRFGGIESIHILNLQKFEDKIYPARRAWKLFSRDGRVQNRPYIYPAIRFFREFADGTVRVFFPEYPDIQPSAVLSNEYNLMIEDEDSFSAELTDTMNEKSRKFICAITKACFYDQTFEPTSDYNQLAHEDIWLPPELHGPDFDINKPMPDGRVELERTAPVFDAENNALIFTVHAIAPFFEKDVKFAFCCSEKITFTEDKNQWVIKTDFINAEKAIFSFGIAEDAAGATAKAKAAIKNHSAALASHIASDRFPLNTEVSVESMPDAATFLKVAPYFQSALCMAESEDEVAIRAAFNKFGFFAFWDHIFPLRDFLIFGKPEVTRKGLQYMLNYPNWDTNPFVMMHLAIALNEYLAFSDDRKLLDRFMEPFKKAFRFTLTLVDEKTGLIRYGLDTAVDIMPELGLDGLFHASCVNSWWYNCCCCFINFAMMTNDTAFADEAASYEKKIAENYTKILFDKENGYLKAAVGANFEEMNCRVFLQTKTIGADYVHGSWLLRKVRNAMSNYIMKHLHHPMGLSAVSYDSEAPAIYLKGTRMNQHLGHSCKVLRSANRTDGVQHQLGNYLYAFNETLNAIETFNYSYCSGDQTQRADWQAFSATAAIQAIVQGKIGIAWHRGGLFYIPADDDDECSINNFTFNGRKYNISISGKGQFAEITLNGRKLEGTMQIPADMLKAENTIVIKRVESTPDRPVLNWLIDTPIADVKSECGKLEFTVGASTFAKMEVFVPGTAEMFIDGQKADFEYDADTKRLWFSGIVNANSTVAIKMF